MSDIMTVCRTAMEWRTGPHTGVSSETIFNHMMGLPRDNLWVSDYPHDPADLGRCRRLLDVMPEWRDRLPEMRGHSVEWAALIDHWDRLCVMMDDEAPDWRYGRGKCPETYALMSSMRGESDL